VALLRFPEGIVHIVSGRIPKVHVPLNTILPRAIQSHSVNVTAAQLYPYRVSPRALEIGIGVDEGGSEETGKFTLVSQAMLLRCWVNPASSYLAQASNFADMAHHHLYSQWSLIATEIGAGLSPSSRSHICQSLDESWPLHPH
jgi:hypothetical protein